MKHIRRPLLSIVLIGAMLLTSGAAAFADTVTLPSSLTQLGEEAFMGDSSLDEVYIPEGVGALPARVFANSSLRAVHLPSTLSQIDQSAFAGAAPTVYMDTQNTFSELTVQAGMTLIVNGALTVDALTIDGLLVNQGTLTVTGSVTTGDRGELFISESSVSTVLPADSFYGGLRFQADSGVQITLTSSGSAETITMIAPGETSAEIVNGGDVVRFCFIPAYSASYSLTSHSNNDTYVTLYDAQGNKLAFNDDSGESYNFLLTYNFEAYTVYFFEVRFYSKDTTGSIPLTLSENFLDTDIVSQSASYVAAPNETVTFWVRTVDSSIDYRWEVKQEGGDWQDAAAFSGYDTDTLSLVAVMEYNGWQFRCRLTGKSGIPVYSKTMTLRVTTNPTRYRALLISEVNFDPVCYRNEGDVLLMKRMLESVLGPTYDSYTITTGRDYTPEQVESAIHTAFAGATEQDVSLFFIATHGDVDYGAGTPYAGALATYDDQFVLFEQLASWLNTVPGKVIVIVESCGSGASIYANGRKGGTVMNDEAFSQALIDAFASVDSTATAIRPNTGELRVENKFYVLTAAALQQMSYGYEKTGASDSYNLFTHWLTDGVGTSGAFPADTQQYAGNNDGFLTLEELYSYISAVGDDYPIKIDNTNYQHQTVKRYPENSDYELFTR